MNRNYYINACVVAMVSILFVGCAQKDKTQKKPNFLIRLVDDQSPV